MLIILSFSFIHKHNTELRGTQSVEVTPQFVSPIWELVSERSNCDDGSMVGGNGEGRVGASDTGREVRMEGEEGEGEEIKEEQKGRGDSKQEKGRRGLGRNSIHTVQSLPSASYAQSFQGF